MGEGGGYKSYIEFILFSAEKMRIMCELNCPDFLSAVPAGLRGVVDKTKSCCLKLTLWMFYGQDYIYFQGVNTC